jgi:ribosome-associated protein
MARRIVKQDDLALRIAGLIQEKKGYEVVILDLRGLTSMADFFVICSADSEPQIRAITEHIRDQLLQQAIKPWHIEGQASSSWILLDFIDVVVHIFKPEARDFYGLERLWGDAPRKSIEEENDAAGPDPG